MKNDQTLLLDYAIVNSFDSTSLTGVQSTNFSLLVAEARKLKLVLYTPGDNVERPILQVTGIFGLLIQGKLDHVFSRGHEEFILVIKDHA
jgi:hypothetical protein